VKKIKTEVMATNGKYNDILGRLREATAKGKPSERTTALTAIRNEAAQLPEIVRREKLLSQIDADLGEEKTAAADIAKEEAALQKRLLEDGAQHRQIIKQFGSARPKAFGVDLKKCLFDPAAFKGTPVRLSLVRIYPNDGICHVTPITNDALLEARYEHPSELSNRLYKAWQLQGDYDTVTITIVYDGAKWWVLDVKL